jgi:hypothetical protein
MSLGLCSSICRAASCASKTLIAVSLQCTAAQQAVQLHVDDLQQLCDVTTAAVPCSEQICIPNAMPAAELQLLQSQTAGSLLTECATWVIHTQNVHKNILQMQTVCSRDLLLASLKSYEPHMPAWRALLP